MIEKTYARDHSNLGSFSNRSRASKDALRDHLRYETIPENHTYVVDNFQPLFMKSTYYRL